MTWTIYLDLFANHTTAGGLSDIFGRRMFIIAGGFVSLIAAIIALAAGNVPTMVSYWRPYLKVLDH